MDKEKCIDYAFALFFVLESIFISYCFIYQVSIIGYILPITVAIASIIVVVYAVRDYFRQQK